MGHYDTYSMLAAAHGWTPEQVNRMDPDFITNELARLAALGRYRQEQAEASKRKGR